MLSLQHSVQRIHEAVPINSARVLERPHQRMSTLYAPAQLRWLLWTFQCKGTGQQVHRMLLEGATVCLPMLGASAQLHQPPLQRFRSVCARVLAFRTIRTS